MGRLSRVIAVLLLAAAAGPAFANAQTIRERGPRQLRRVERLQDRQRQLDLRRQRVAREAMRRAARRVDAARRSAERRLERAGELRRRLLERRDLRRERRFRIRVI